MKSIFYNIDSSEQELLSKSLEASNVNLKKNTALSKILYKNVLGIVISGSAQVIKIDYEGDKNIVEDLTPNMVFGSSISFLDGEDIELVAKEDAKLLVFDYERILNYNNYTSKSYVQFLKNILEITNDKINKENIRTAIISKKSIRSKLLTSFETYAKGGKVILGYTYTELAGFLAVDRCAMTRELKNLKEEGFIETNGRIITIKSPQSYAPTRHR